MEADWETRDRCYRTNCLGPAWDINMRRLRVTTGWQTSPGDLEHVRWCHLVTWQCQGHSLAPDDMWWWYHRISDQVLMSVTSKAKSQNDTRGVAGTQLKSSVCQLLDRDKIPRFRFAQRWMNSYESGSEKSQHSWEWALQNLRLTP